MCLYLASVLFQLFVYCWYGNEVILKSTEIKDAIFQSNWGCLKSSTKRNFIIVMIQAQRAIEFTSGYVITLSLESYVAVGINQV
ncbi:odorant receptor 82a-like [Cephus cinctus]|uniref:Odorant receptor 82a-like n=1 Tax=Cephus cinctus TaxID=211228 RepID=A0AAJ7RUZ3_CEPCN|nr:odorant receptor 82a-like [Cephus cinctus]